MRFFSRNKVPEPDVRVGSGFNSCAEYWYDFNTIILDGEIPSLALFYKPWQVETESEMWARTISHEYLHHILHHLVGFGAGHGLDNLVRMLGKEAFESGLN